MRLLAGSSGAALRLVAVFLALLFTTGVLLLAGAPPLEAYRQIVSGSLGSVKKITDVLVTWVPLVLATSGVLVTFAAGLWNIGIEGQITLGAIFATGTLRLTLGSGLPPAVAIGAAILAGIAGGAFWALLAGLLKVYAGVNEIFGGLGLNFVAVALNVWLIFGPWGRPGVASMSGTEPLPDFLSLPALAGLRLSPFAVLMAVFLFEVPLRGSIPLLFGMAGVFLLGALSLGLVQPEGGKAMGSRDYAQGISKSLRNYMLKDIDLTL